MVTSTVITVPEQDLLRIIDWLLRFPRAEVCRHAVAAELLSVLERHGAQVCERLADAVVSADDSAALDLIAERIEALPRE